MSQSTGCDSPLLFEEIYTYYAQAEAWYVAPGAQAALQRLKDSGEVWSSLRMSQTCLLNSIIDTCMRLIDLANFYHVLHTEGFCTF